MKIWCPLAVREGKVKVTGKIMRGWVRKFREKNEIGGLAVGVGPKRQTVIWDYVQLLFRVMEHELDFSSTLWIRALYAIMISKKQEAKNQCSIQTTLTLWRTITMRIIRPNWFLSFFLIYFKIFYFLTGRVVQNSLSRIGQCWHFRPNWGLRNGSQNGSRRRYRERRKGSRAREILHGDSGLIGDFPDHA